MVSQGYFFFKNANPPGTKEDAQSDSSCILRAELHRYPRDVHGNARRDPSDSQVLHRTVLDHLRLSRDRAYHCKVPDSNSNVADENSVASNDHKHPEDD